MLRLLLLQLALTPLLDGKMMTHGAAAEGANETVMAGNVAGCATDDGAAQAADGVCGRRWGNHGEAE